MPNVGKTDACTSLSLNFPAGEKITKMTLWISAQKIVGVVMETQEGLSISWGPQLSTLTREEVVIPEDEVLIGFEGTQGSTQVFSMTPLTVK